MNREITRHCEWKKRVRRLIYPNPNPLPESQKTKVQYEHLCFPNIKSRRKAVPYCYTQTHHTDDPQHKLTSSAQIVDPHIPTLLSCWTQAWRRGFAPSYFLLNFERCTTLTSYCVHSSTLHSTSSSFKLWTQDIEARKITQVPSWRSTLGNPQSQRSRPNPII